MTVVWTSDTNYHKILRTLSLNFSKNYCSFEKLYPKLQSVFHPISRHLEVSLKKLGCASFFNPLLSVWISDETLRVFLDILLLTCPNYMSSIRQGFQARILLFSSLARSFRYINLTDFELLPICCKCVFVVNIYKFVYTNILFLCIFLYTNQGIASKEVCVLRGFMVSRLSALHRL